jgi:hypothetical protein
MGGKIVGIAVLILALAADGAGAQVGRPLPERPHWVELSIATAQLLDVLQRNLRTHEYALCLTGSLVPERTFIRGAVPAYIVDVGPRHVEFVCSPSKEYIGAWHNHRLGGLCEASPVDLQTLARLGGVLAISCTNPSSGRTVLLVYRGGHETVRMNL